MNSETSNYDIVKYFPTSAITQIGKSDYSFKIPKDVKKSPQLKVKKKLNLPEFDDHESIFFFNNKETGLKSFVCIHDTTLGPAVGGTRMFSYKTELEALSDSLLLSKAMTYKCALAKVRFGGGKAVIIADPKKQKSKKLLTSFAKKINILNGNFYTGQDMGLTKSDVAWMLKFSKFFIGKPKKAEDPSPYAASSTFLAIQTVVEYHYGNRDLSNLTIAIKGIGKVGRSLLELLSKTGAKIIVADIDRTKIIEVKKKFPNTTVVSPEEIHRQKVNIYAPCAVGKEFRDNNVNQLRAEIICGAANNQLATDEVGNAIFRNGILYVPDYVANSGGLINVVDELEKGGYNRKRVVKRIGKLEKTLRLILNTSEKKKVSPHLIADRLAEKRLSKRSGR